MKRITDERLLNELSRDAGIIVLRPAAAVETETDEEVIEVLRDSGLKGEPVTPRGAGTSIPSQAVGRGMILLQRRRQITPGEGRASCGPSVLKVELNSLLDPKGVWVPPDPSSYLTCTVGGMVANNSAGIRTYKYGSTVDYVKELQVVLPKEGMRTLKPVTIEDAHKSGNSVAKVADLLIQNWGVIQKERPNVTKNTCGYRLEKALHDGLLDLPKLFCGSEGTLGIITDITFATPPKPRSKVLMVVETSLSELDKAASIFRSMNPSAVELVDKSVFKEAGKEERLQTLSRSDEQYLVFCELDGKGEDEAGLSLEEAASSEIRGFEPLAMADPGDMASAWAIRNETLTLATELKRGSRILLPGVEDLVVPPDRLKDLIALLTDQFESRGLGYISYGHAGDANLHMRPFLDVDSRKEMSILDEIMEESFEAVWKMGGSISGEHGDGMLRAKFVRRQYPQTYDLMKEIRKTFDPESVLSPGVKIV